MSEQGGAAAQGCAVEDRADNVDFLAPPARIDTTKLADWVRRAQRGAELRIGRGVSAPTACGLIIAEAVLRLHGLGYVTPVQRRRGVPPGHGVDYILQRTAKPVAFKDRL